ncbi:MAG: hypothetical protein LBE75_04865 [Burkholderiales bacterium]|jgi:hypothetical protein|nr:hypothetical protein [Burkholderiales bacterium]
MSTFRKKALCAVLAGVGAAGWIGSAQAVSLNPAGLGQVLIYPYYTVRDSGSGNAFNSLMSVVNHTERAKAVRVRFLEGKASQEVLDFNLYLSQEDVWTAAIVPTDDGTGAKIMTHDTSCTSPPIPAGGQPFSTVLFSASYADGEDATADRTKEGYAEIIEMADIVTGSATEKNVTHATVAGWWKPLNCGGVWGDWSKPSWVDSDLVGGSGGLSGSMTLISVNEAQGVAFKATALDGFFKGTEAKDNLWAPAGSIEPNLASVYPKVSTVVDGFNAYVTTWPSNSGADPVSAVLMSQSVYNEYVLDKTIAAKTDWLITMPTKRFYYDAANGDGRPLKAGYKLFQRDFIKGGACESFPLIGKYFDREERRVVMAGFPGQPQPSWNLCWGANIVTFGWMGTASVFHAKNRVTLPVAFENGWARLTFDANQGYRQLTGGTTQWIDSSAMPPTVNSKNEITFTGLPMLGFAVQQFNNGEVPSSVPGGKVWASYAGRIEHSFEKRIDVK